MCGHRIRGARRNWARFSEESKAKALAAGVQANDADIPAFQATVEGLLTRETQGPVLASLYKRVRDLSG